MPRGDAGRGQMGTSCSGVLAAVPGLGVVCIGLDGWSTTSASVAGVAGLFVAVCSRCDAEECSLPSLVQSSLVLGVRAQPG